MELRPGTVLRGNKATYRVAAVLCQNDFTTNYRAIATDLDGRKTEVMLVEHFMRQCCRRAYDGMRIEPDGLAGDTVKAFRDAFVRDALAMIEMSEEKEGLLLYREVFQANATAYVVTDMVVGETLESYVGRVGPLTLDQARTLCTPLHLAVRFLHARNLVHLAICPANIVLTRRRGDLFPILTHLGGVHRMADETESLDALPPLECPDGYAPPEQYGLKGRTSPNTDVYSLAATLLFMLSGAKPPRELTPDAVRVALPSRTPLIIVNGIIRATRDDPTQRTATVTAYRDELLAFYNRAAPSHTFPPLITDPPRRRAPWRVLLLGACVAALCVLLVLFFVLPRRAQADDSAPKPHVSEAKVLEQLRRNMVYVPGGTFSMGAQPGPAGLHWQSPVHAQTVGPFYISRYEVTQQQWETVMGRNPSEFKGDHNPVETVTWGDCDLFVKRLRERTGLPYRLPTEAEWEYAARGAHKSRGTTYAGSNDMEAVAWCSLNSDGHTHPVGQLPPNELGLYDMTGNVWEWTADVFELYPGNTLELPTQAVPGGRSFRGGSWYSMPRFSTVAYRFMFDPTHGNSTLGLRLAMSAPEIGDLPQVKN